MNEWTIRDIPSQAGKLVLITGANSGIGWEAALELARAGASVILTARSEAKGQDAVHRIQQLIPQAKVRYEILDLADLKSVHAFAAKMAAEDKIDVLINNAGVMAVPKRQLSPDGYELQLATNFIGPFALTLLLLPVLRRSPAPRVVTVSSGAANMGLRRIRFEDLNWEQTYGPWKAYCQSKLADLMFALELGPRCERAGFKLLSLAAHPGYARTKLQSSGSGTTNNFFQSPLALLVSQDAAHGALPTLRAATDPGAAQGNYYGPDKFFQLHGHPVLVRIPKPAQNAAAREQLWKIAEQLSGIKIQI